jgi:Zn-dependent protease
VQLLNILFLDKPLRLEASMAGWQQLYWDNQLVAQQEARTDIEHSNKLEFTLTRGDQKLPCQLEFGLDWQPFQLRYRAYADGDCIAEGERNSDDIARQTLVVKPAKVKNTSTIGLLSLGFKLFKSAKVIKLAFAGASLAAYSWLFSLPFALSLLAVLVFHEYGHIRAMKYFGMKTKGIYLIPFVGGMALSDEKINTRWQDVVISIMGPTFGLIMSVVALLLYWLTGEVFFAALASLNAMLNVFNLLPILPLDGGHILKSISFSMNSMAGLLMCVGGAALGVWISYSLGLALLGLLLLVGSIEILAEWKGRHRSHLLPLDRYGQVFSTLWYLLTVAGLVGIIVVLSDSDEPLLRLPLSILQS